MINKKFPSLLILLFFCSTVVLAQGEQVIRVPDQDRTRIQATDELGLRLAIENSNQTVVIDPNEYIVGVNDVFTIEVKGSISVLLRALPVNPTGDVVIPEIAAVRVADLTLREAIDKMEQVVKQKFRQGDIRISLEFARPIHVSLTGNIANPGVFKLPYGTTLDMLIVQGLLPLNVASVFQSDRTIDKRTMLIESEYDLRNVRIERSNGSVINADLLAFYLGGDGHSNPILRSRDIIHINKFADTFLRINVSGGVNNPASYSFKEGDTIEALLRISGGFTPFAITDHVTIVRDSGQGIQRIRVAKDQFGTFNLKAHDNIVVSTDQGMRTRGTVKITGEILEPGFYSIRNGVTSISDIIEMAGGLTKDALTSSVVIKRGKQEKPDDISSRQSQMEQIPMLLRTSDQFREAFEFFQMQLNMGLDIVVADLRDAGKSASIFLQDGDEIVVERDKNTVLLMGQFNHIGYIPFVNIRSIEDLVAAAGGLTNAADPSRIFVIKAGTGTWFTPENTTIESGDIIFADRSPIIDYQASRLLDIQEKQIELQKNQQRISRRQLLLSAVGTITGIVTTYLLITRD